MQLKRADALLCGVLVLAGAAWIPTGDPTLIYLSYALLALTAFALELADGSTMGFAFVIVALPQLGWSDSLLMAGSAVFILEVVRHNRRTPQELLRSLAVTSVAVIVSEAAYHCSLVTRLYVPMRLMLAAAVCFIPYNVRGWRKWNLSAFPYYAATAALVSLFPVSVMLAPLIVLTWCSYLAHRRSLEQQCEQSRSTAALHLRTIEMLAGAIETRDQPLAGQSRRVQIYSAEIAKELNLPEEEVEALRTASLLYDIGELAIPEHITLKSGKLTKEEFEKVKTHTLVGSAILERACFPYPVVPIVRAHHERWDGAGYPYGLKGGHIPIGARILAAVDALDALASPRQHRAACSLDEAVQRVVAGAGSAFDPQVTALIAKHYRQWEKRAAAKSEHTFIDSIFSAQREAAVHFELNHSLGCSLELTSTFTAVQKAVRNLIPFQTLVVWMERQGVLSAAYLSGEHLALFSSLHIPLGTGVSGRAAVLGETILNGDPLMEMTSVENPKVEYPEAGIGKPGLNASLCPFHDVLVAPLRAGDLRGALALYRSNGERFSADEARVLTSIASKLTVPLANGLRFQQLHEEAHTDGLTGLPNAQALATRLLDLGSVTTVVICDLDGFKQVNDRFGHLEGNRLLEALADGFRKSCRACDFVARLGGDEFVLLLPNVHAEDVCLRLDGLRAMVRAIGEAICGETVLDASFGAATYPYDGLAPDELLACADSRMYTRKAGQKDRFIQTLYVTAGKTRSG